jgi:hypothetical protein
LAPRYTANQYCTVCNNNSKRAWTAKTFDHRKAYRLKYEEENREAYLERKRRYRRENRLKIYEQFKDWASRNKDRVRLHAQKYRSKQSPNVAKEYHREYATLNPEKINAIGAKRHAAKMGACPPWLKGDLRKQVDAMYAECRRITEETGIEHHVDHIVPLQGDNVCGLHVPCNLRIITAVENAKKGNRLLYEISEPYPKGDE